MNNFTRFHPVLWFGAISLLSYGSLVWSAPQYDSGGIKTILFFLGYKLSFIFRWIGVILNSLNGGQPMRYQLLITIALGIGLFLVTDRLVTSLGKR